MKAFKPVYTKSFKPVYMKAFKHVYTKPFKSVYTKAFKPVYTEVPQSFPKMPKTATIVPQIVPNVPKMAPKWPQNCQQWPNFENNFTYLRPSRRRREGRHYRKHMLDDPPNMIDLINYVFCSSQSLCSSHSMWPFVAFYVPEVHGDIPPSLMVLLYHLKQCDNINN